MAIGWEFPSNNYGTLNGIGEAGIETFKGAPYRSLAREICQNSLDARTSKEKAVRVEFVLTKVVADSLPDFPRLKDALNRCLEFWNQQNNAKTVSFFQSALSAANAPAINVMRISDFNTTGLTGSDKEFSSPWQDLVKASGVSGKGGSSGGSFGIGKSAPFACSSMRTVFYATKDIYGTEAFQGIARLVSFRQKGFFGGDKDSITTGIGYCGEKKKLSAVRQCLSIDHEFHRTEPGTDVFILGFMDNGKWKREMVKAVLEDFLIAINNEALEVVIGGTSITHDTLPALIEEYRDEAKAAWNYWQVFTSPDTETFREDFAGLGNFELHVLIGNGLHRRALISRINGMKIFDQKSISGSIQFAAVCILADDRLNQYFREMENPQHDAWEPERHSDPSGAKKNKLAFAHRIKELIIEKGRSIVVDQVDAEGVGEFLPDLPDETSINQEHKEDLTDAVKDTEVTVTDFGKWQKGKEYTDTGAVDYDSETGASGDEDHTGGSGKKDHADNEPNVTHDGTGFGAGIGDDPGTHGEGTNHFQTGNDTGNMPSQSAHKAQLMSVRLFRTDAKSNSYRLSYVPGKSYVGGYIQIFLSGEQGTSDDIVILNARRHVTQQALEVQGNRIRIDQIEAGKKNSIDFSIQRGTACSMEVSLYGYSK